MNSDDNSLAYSFIHPFNFTYDNILISKVLPEILEHGDIITIKAQMGQNHWL